MILFSKLASYHSLRDKNSPPQKKNPKLKKKYFDRNTSKFAGMFEKPPSTHMKKFSNDGFGRNPKHCAQLAFSCLQRTNFPSRTPTQDRKLFDIGCETFFISS